MERVAVVSGGTRGIGAAISTGLRSAGYRVAAIYRSNADVAERFAGANGIDVFSWDVSDPAACADGLAQVVETLGDIDVLVNNAGITNDAMFHRMSFDQWRAVLSTNLDSMFAMTRPVIEGMRNRGFGRIINISSINGQKGQFGQANYAAAKAGVLGFTRALALENAAKGITINAICPGYIDTEMLSTIDPKIVEGIVASVPARRLGQASEIADAVLYLASEQAGYMNGATLTINGGQHMAS